MMIIRLAALAGTVVATVRQIAERNQTELGEAAGVAGSQISGYERSKQIPSVDILLRLLHACGWHLVAVPALHAETSDEREAVIRAAQRYHDAARGDDLSLGVPRAAELLHAAVNALADAERNSRGKGAGPDRAHELLRLRARVDEQQAEIERMRRIVTAAAEQLDEAIEVHP